MAAGTLGRQIDWGQSKFKLGGDEELGLAVGGKQGPNLRETNRTEAGATPAITTTSSEI